ncbi:MAG: 4-hydroxy-3-methylbut-2-enyl diphosphate reductase, partial [Planctomycetota bacterium]
VRTWGEARLGVVCQTTTPTEQVDRVMAAIRQCNPTSDVQLIDTVCSPTKARGAALESLLPHIDALVVVGGRDSNNTRRLAARGREHGIRTVHVQGVEGLDASWFDGVRVVGLTAGTSTLAETIDAVHGWLAGLAAAPPTPAPRAG